MGIGAMLMAGSALVAVATAAGGAGIEDAPAPPHLTYVFTLHVEVGAPQEQGTVDGRQVRFVPITGGRVTGPRLSGAVLPGGGDWQAIHGDGLTDINTRYSLRTDDGTVVDIVNPGVRVASIEVAGRLARGEPVDASLYYFRTSPRFTVPDGSHAWLRRAQFVGRGVRRPHDVEIQIFAVE